jgi:hypothetical protein
MDGINHDLNVVPGAELLGAEIISRFRNGQSWPVPCRVRALRRQHLDHDPVPATGGDPEGPGLGLRV